MFSKKKKWNKAKKYHKYGYLIAARNEEKVIKNLIDSINAQSYPKELMKIFVVADNCSDNTSLIASKAGAKVFIRKNDSLIGKGYALDYLYKRIKENKEYDDIECFFVFDADNLVSKDYTKNMNDLFDQGIEVATSFRDSKNFNDSWVSAGQSMSFYRECLLIHHSRSHLNMGTYVSGTGFFVSRSVLDKFGGFNFHTLVEDIEFSLVCALNDIKIGYCSDAVFYDEQPIKLKDSLKQRLRWCKGVHQCHFKYGGRLTKKFFEKFSFTTFELKMHVMPLPIASFVWSIFYIFINLLFAIFNVISFDEYSKIVLSSILSFLFSLIFIAIFHAIICEIKYHKNIKAPWYKQILYVFTFPFFMALYLPLTFIALFKKVKWEKIEHNVIKTIEKM